MDYLSRRAGLAVGGHRGDVLRQAVARAAGDDGGQPAAAVARLASDRGAFQRLCDDVTVQESYFGREPAKFDLLRDRIIDELDPSGRGLLHVWSAGCARGEEAYALALVLAEAGLNGRYRILGTDLSSAAVSAAREATYGSWALRGLDHGTVSRLFAREGARFRVRDRFRTHVAFDVHNILDPLPSRPPFDIIFCRNLLIYLTAEAVKLAAARLVGLLAPGGWLVTGAADPILDEADGLEVVSTQHGLAYRRPRKSCPGSAPEGRRPGPIGSLQPGTAERLAPRALAVAPTLPAHLLLVNALAHAGALVEAVDAAAAAPCPTEPEIRRVRAAVSLESGHVAVAKAAQRAAFLAPRTVAAHLLLGRASQGLDHHGAARRARRNAERLISGGKEES